MAKVRKVDFSPDEFLLGVAGMRPFDIGVYWVICSLIYSSGQNIPDKDERLFTLLDARKADVLASIDRLVAVSKVYRVGSELVVKRCRTEIEAAMNRMRASSEGASKRWRTGGGNKGFQRVADAVPKNTLMPSPSPSPSPAGALGEVDQKPKTDGVNGSDQDHRLASLKAGIWLPQWGPRPDRPAENIGNHPAGNIGNSEPDSGWDSP